MWVERWGGCNSTLLQIISKHHSHHLITPPSLPPLHAVCVCVSNWSFRGKYNVCPVPEPAPNALNVMDVKTGREQQNFLIITSWRWSKYLDCITVLLLPICTLPPSALLPVPSTISLHWHTYKARKKKKRHLHLWIYSKKKLKWPHSRNALTSKRHEQSNSH